MQLNKEKLNYHFLIKPISYLISTLTIKSKQINTGFIRMDILGDNFVFFPFLFKYTKLYPNSLWIINQTIAPLYKLLNVKNFPINTKRFRSHLGYRVKVLKKLTKIKFDTLINITPHRVQPEGDEILKLLKSKNKICYGNDSITTGTWKSKNSKICSQIINYNYTSSEKKQKYIHIFNHEKDFFEKLTKTEITTETKTFYINSFITLKKSLKQYIDTKSNYITLITDAGLNFRRYKEKNWQIILDNLPKNSKIIQLGLNKFPLQHPNLIDLTGKTSLEEAMSIVMNASLVIGNETGLTHLAYLSGVPTVCILGGGHFGRFLPWPEFDDIVKCVYKPMDCFQCGWQCKYVNLEKGETPPCISQISPTKVLKAVEELNYLHKIFI